MRRTGAHRHQAQTTSRAALGSSKAVQSRFDTTREGTCLRYLDDSVPLVKDGMKADCGGGSLGSGEAVGGRQATE